MMGIVLLRDMIFVNYMCEEKMLDTDIFRSTYAQKRSLLLMTPLINFSNKIALDLLCKICIQTGDKPECCDGIN